MKIADFFIQITAKGDLKELKMIADAQKAIKEQSRVAIATAKVKVQELKKQTEEIKLQKKIKKDEPKNLREYLMAQGKVWSQQNKMNLTIAKGVLQTMGLTGAFMATTTAIIGAAVALDRMITSLAQANQLYTNFQRQTGMAMGSALGISGAMANLDVTMTPQDVMQNMRNLQTSLVGVQFGMGNIAPYQMAGINPFTLNAENMLDTIKKQMKGFAPAYRTFLLQQMGLDPRLGALIDLSDTEYLKYKKESLELYLSPEDRKTIQRLAPEWNKVNLKFTKAWDKTVLLLMKDFQGLGTEIGHIIDVISRLIEVVDKILKPVLDLLTMILKPIYYLLDDIIVWLLGGKSIIGDIFKGQFPSKKEWSNIIREAFNLPNFEFKEGSDKLPWWSKVMNSNNILSKNNPFALNTLIFSILKGTIDQYKNGGSNGKIISMNVENNIHVGSAEDGYKLVDPLRLSLNGAIAQYGG